ncbi:MAG: hypothetical protein PHQ40_16440 [Anaerolineaceae bacterium]|nr:hypothetical protein [Anaerolineaceae bacterium]
MLRQGDVFLISVGANPVTEKAPLENGRIILAHGEVTGHAHAIADARKAIKFEAAGQTFLEVLESVELVHEEHAEVRIPPGIYRVLIQTEYTPEELRNVQD